MPISMLLKCNTIFLIIIFFTKLQAFSCTDLSAAKKRLEVLENLQQKTDKLWKEIRWVAEIIAFSRQSKSLQRYVSIASIFQISGGTSDMSSLAFGDNSNSLFSLHSEDEGIKNTFSSPPAGNLDVGRKHVCVASYYDPNDDPAGSNTSYVANSKWSPLSEKAVVESNLSIRKCKSADPFLASTSGTLRVYADYVTGLPKCACVNVRVTVNTTSRDVIKLAVCSVMMSSSIKHAECEYHSEKDLDNFCLVFALGSHERQLEDDFQPLKLYSPWLQGRFYLRRINCELTAIRHGQATRV